jgi:hypothetical protein
MTTSKKQTFNMHEGKIQNFADRGHFETFLMGVLKKINLNYHCSKRLGLEPEKGASVVTVTAGL